jgi:hypothetical protein
MPPITFDSLPSEIVLNIIIRVRFSYEDFVALRLTNRRINTLMCQRGYKLLEDIAKAQFPDALWAATTPRIPFDEKMSSPRLSQLQNLSVETSIINETIDRVQVFRQSMIKEGSLLGLALGVKGWKTNLRTALYVQQFAPVPKTTFRCGIDARNSDKYTTWLNRLPLHSILAIRHSTLMGFEVLKALDRSFSNRRIDLEQPAIPSNKYTDANLRRHIEFSAQIGADGWLDVFDTIPFEDSSIYEDSIETDVWKSFKKNIDITSAFRGRRRFGNLMYIMRACVDSRIRDIIDSWEDFIVQEPETIAALQREEAQEDLKAVRALVESFLEQ